MGVVDIVAVVETKFPTSEIVDGVDDENNEN